VNATVTSWRDGVSAQAQQDLDALLNIGLRFAQEQLAARGSFFPYAAAISTDGHGETIAPRPDPNNERPVSAHVIGSCHAELVRRRDLIRAGAIVSDVRMPDGSDAVRVDLEHAEGPALTVLLPYAKRRLSKRIDYGQVRAQTGPRQIWT
jgi:hypothetical protein